MKLSFWNRALRAVASLPSALLLAVVLAPQACHAQAPKVLDEPTEWTWSVRPNPVDPALPNVLLIGDSITRAYYPDVTRQLAGKANCFLFASSAGAGDPRLPHQIDELFMLYPETFAVIHLNNGMHGWGYTEPQWSAGLGAEVAQLEYKARSAKIVWSSITPVLTDQKYGATNDRIDARNAAALAIMKPLHIPVDDQHALMLPHQDLHVDAFHYKPEGSAMQAEQVVKSILPLLAAR